MKKRYFRHLALIILPGLFPGCANQCVRCDPTDTDSLRGIARDVHLFYYPWYANPETDSAWSQWNHVISTRDSSPRRHHEPPEDIGANFYPELGLYSSNNPGDLRAHMRMIRRAGAGAIALSWWGKDTFTGKAVPRILQAAEEYGIQVNFHIEPYPGRSAASVREDIIYLIDTFGDSKAFYRNKKHGNLPMFYLYDSYLVDVEDWAGILSPDADNTIRGTKHDAIVIALYVKKGDEAFVSGGHFDGFYTYFATNGFTHGSTYANWAEMAAWAKANNKIFIPSVGPGYDDTRIRPWNGQNQRGRENGAYYDRMFQAAIDAAPDMISVTSFNEWHEGTQIEPSIPKSIPGYAYLDFSPRDPDYYLERTRHWVKRFGKARK